MGLFTSISIASTGMSVQRLRSDVIADNIANVDTTRTPEGGPYRRSQVVLKAIADQPYWRSPFLLQGMDNGGGEGVEVAKIGKDMTAPLRMVWDPTHPDAIKSGPNAGYVEYPNVDIVTEMTDMIEASRAYEANASIVEASKSMFSKALQIGQA
jgi:flagellar basal-body rod protein FlgC